MDNWAKDVKVNLVIQLGFHDATSHAATAIDIVPSQVCDDTIGAKDTLSQKANWSLRTLVAFKQNLLHILWVQSAALSEMRKGYQK